MENKETHNIPLWGSEPRFTELNKVLEEKVNNLMADVDMILSKQTDIIRCPKQRPNKKQASKMPDSIVQLEAKNSDCELTSVKSTIKEINSDNQNDEIGSISSNGNIAKTLQWHTATTKSTSESVIRFFKGQITKLQTDLQAVQYEKKKMDGQCKDLEAQLRKKEENEEKMLNQQNCYRDSILKVETANSDLCLKVQAQNTQISLLKKEIENLKKKLVSLNQISTYNELKLNRNLDENDKLRSSLKISQTEEKESREYVRKIKEEKRLALKVSEKQRTEIFQAFKKQMLLVSNLKKQKLYLETNKEIQFIEKEFAKILEWKVT